MASLVKAFENMSLLGLIGKAQCHCNECGYEMVLKKAQQWRREGKPIKGFVYFGELERHQGAKDLWSPLTFGRVKGDKLTRYSGECLRVGKIITGCLEGERFKYIWDGKPGSKIQVKVDTSFLTANKNVRCYKHSHVFEQISVPDRVFDHIEFNPARILNITKLRAFQQNSTKLNEELCYPREGEIVKIGFYALGATRRPTRKLADKFVILHQIEPMGVEVTDIFGAPPDCTYRGTLMSAPVFIDPAKLRAGSTIRFTAEHVYPVVQSKKRRDKDK